MKKKALLIALVIGQNLSFGQQTLTFEGLLQTPNSYDNGSSGNGDFDINDIVLTNTYDSQWGSWNGFSISNVVDNTTAGWGNQFAAYPGSGASGSETYAVFYPDGTISMNNWGGITGFKITNTTYAAISMRDGDAFSKQFGSPNGADGNPDGTNGDDFFRVWIIGEDSLGTHKDSILFYLADYRFANDHDDYIVDTWEQIDLTSFGFLIDKVRFRFESSDVGAWGINTPQYFAIDDIEYYYIIGIDENDLMSVQCYPNPVIDHISVDGMKMGDYSLIDHSGKFISSGTLSELELFSFARLPQGSYFLKLSNGTSSVVKHIVH